MNPFDPSIPATKHREYANTAKAGAVIINIGTNNLKQNAYLDNVISR